MEGEGDADGEPLALIDGEIEADGLTEGDSLVEGLRLALGDSDRDCEAEGEGDSLDKGLSDGLVLLLGERLGESLAEGD
jgi:hypothetical protein